MLSVGSKDNHWMGLPTLSVVIASVNTAHVINECLDSLLEQVNNGETEIIVADSSTDGTDTLIRNQYPKICLLHWGEPKTIPQLRGEGIAMARGAIIAFLDPYCFVHEGWVGSVLQSFAERDVVAIGGSVELDKGLTSSLAAWAIYFNEYADFTPPIDPGLAKVLPGNNIAYRRTALRNMEGLKNIGFWKSFHNMKLKAGGEALWFSPSMSVKIHKPIPFVEFFFSRYHHGRCFGGMRVAGVPLIIKWFHILTVPLLPSVFLWRQFRGLWPKRPYRGKFLLSLPLTFLLALSWTWGELWGYLRGPGESCNQLIY